jgi:hypothetical protein
MCCCVTFYEILEGLHYRSRADAAPSFDHIVGDGEHRWRHHDVERLRGLKVDDEFEFCKLCDREVGGLRAVLSRSTIK